jgi:two-component system response regulator ResD
MQKILIIDDDTRLVENVTKYMHDFGFQVDTASNGIEGLEKAKSFDPDLIVLDLMMPGLDGVEVCREIRKISTTPIIMLTARVEETDIVAGLEVGADDYITKPFSLRELVARIKARLRHEQFERTSQAHKEVMEFGVLTIDSARHEVYKKDIHDPQSQQKIILTGTEFNLLWLLASNPGIVFSREKLLEDLRSRELEAFDRSIDAHISHLRKKIEDTPKTPRYIITVWGTGYKFQGT